MMNSRERLLASVNHREPDWVPFDLGGMAQSGLHRVAYAALRRRLGLPAVGAPALNINTQQARLDWDVIERLRIDACLVYSRWADPEQAQVREDGEYLAYTDEWGVGRRMPRQAGRYFDVYRHPLDVDDLDAALACHPWPDPLAADRFAGLRDEARQARERGRFVVLMGLCPGIVEMTAWLLGYERFYTGLAAEPALVARCLGKVAELKAAYWQRALAECGEFVDAVNEADDMAGQSGLLFSVAAYRRVVKPFHRELFAAARRAAPHVKLLFHSCGAVRPLIPDLIDAGVDILNPVQLSAAGMDGPVLKREFGSELALWGGGIDAQHTLSAGSLQDIRDEVRRNVDALASGGGYVFAPTHIIQPDVPPENILAMWEAFQQAAGAQSSPAQESDP
jgi:uroporphyrinogen decarboxylase